MESISLIFQVVVAISVYYVWIFRFHNVIAEFKQFGYSDVFRNFVGAAKMSISALLIMGLCYNDVTLYAALGMAFFMVFIFAAKAFPEAMPNRIDTWMSRIENFKDPSNTSGNYQIDRAKMANNNNNYTIDKINLPLNVLL